MLSIKNRFHGHGSLRFVYAKGQVVRSRSFVLKYSVNKRRTEPRVAVVVSKKVMKSAVRRNRIRRRMYECIRLELPDLDPCTDIVFIITSADILFMDSQELTDIVKKSCINAGFYK